MKDLSKFTCWSFATITGGQLSGFNNAGVETFKGNFDRYLAREAIQNSLDARNDKNKPVEVQFLKASVATESIPDVAKLRNTISRCLEYWKEDTKAAAFFKRALSLLDNSDITTLRISDHNTTGVSGGDLDKKKGWFHLVRCAGSSSKQEGEGGSFGIGKNAPFAASQLRTVLYSTKTLQQENAFLGVATLASHELGPGQIVQPVGFLGGPNGETVRDLARIPVNYQRNSPGLDITIVGFPDEEDWENDLIYSILDNFWPAIHFSDLVVKVGQTLIDKDSLSSLLEKFGTREDFTAHLYYEAFITPTASINENLKNLGDCSLYLKTGEKVLPKKVAMVRKTGMVIFAQSFRSILPFCGVFMCRNEKGNAKLREMEPPRHDTWDPDHPEKGANRKISKEYGDFIRAQLRSLTPSDNTAVIELPELGKYLPFDDESAESSLGIDSGEHSEGLAARPPRHIIVRAIDPEKRNRVPDTIGADDDGKEETDTPGNGEEAGVSSNDNRNAKDGGQAGNADDSQQAQGAPNGTGPQNSIPIKFRAFTSDPESLIYTVSVLSQAKQQQAFLTFNTVCDDGRIPTHLARARAGDTPLDVKTNIVGPLLLPSAKDSPLRLEITLQRAAKIALEVVAHEV